MPSERQVEGLHLVEHRPEVGQAGAVQGLDGAEGGIVGLPGLLVRHRQVADRAGAAELLAELHQLGAGLGEGLGLCVLLGDRGLCFLGADGLFCHAPGGLGMHAGLCDE